MRNGADKAGPAATSSSSQPSVGRCASVSRFTRAISCKHARSSSYEHGMSISSIRLARWEKSRPPANPGGGNVESGLAERTSEDPSRMSWDEISGEEIEVVGKMVRVQYNCVR